MESVETQLDEVEVLQSILCANGEVVIRTPELYAKLRSLVATLDTAAASHKPDGDDIIGLLGEDPLVIELNLSCPVLADVDITSPERAQGTHENAEVKLVLSLPRSYPNVLPDVSVSSTATSRSACDTFKSALVHHCRGMRGQIMLLDLVQYVRDQLHCFADRAPAIDNAPSLSAAISNDLEPVPVYYCLVHVDHMHTRASYCKTLKAWCNELGITGRVLFQSRLILILLESATRELLRTYIRWHRTRPVDVDTAGRTCKEHCMKLLMDPRPLAAAKEAPWRASPTAGDEVGALQRRFSAFSVCDDVGSRLELEGMFSDWDLASVYSECVDGITRKG